MTQRKPREAASSRPKVRSHSSDDTSPPVRPRTDRRITIPSWAKWRIEGLSAPRAVILIVVVCFLVITLATPVHNYFEQRAVRSELETQNARYRESNTKKEAEIERWNDPTFLDQEARRRLLVVPRGETAYRVVRPTDVQKKPGKHSESDLRHSERKGPWYSDLWNDVSAPVQ